MQLAPVPSSAHAVLPYLPSSAAISTDTLKGPADSSAVFLGTLPKGLTITAREILARINQELKAKLPEGVQSLRPEEATPEATAETVVSGIALIFDAYSKQHSDVPAEEMLTRFMTAARSGVEKGYGEAFKFLEGIGAFSIEGVKDGVEKTKALIEEKLAAFETQKRIDLGLEPDVRAASASTVSEAVLGSAGKTVSVVA